MVETSYNSECIETTNKDSANTEWKSNQSLCSLNNITLNHCEYRSNDGHGNVTCDKNSNQWSYEEIQHSRHSLVEPLLKLTHEQDCNDNWNDMALVTSLIDVVCTKPYIPFSNLRCLHSCNTPSIDQGWVNHYETDNRCKELITTELLRCGDCNQDRQHRKSRTCEEVD